MLVLSFFSALAKADEIKEGAGIEYFVPRIEGSLLVEYTICKGIIDSIDGKGIAIDAEVNRVAFDDNRILLEEKYITLRGQEDTRVRVLLETFPMRAIHPLLEKVKRGEVKKVHVNNIIHVDLWGKWQITEITPNLEGKAVLIGLDIILLVDPDDIEIPNKNN